VELKVTRMHGGKPWMTELDNPFVQAAARAIEMGFNRAPVYTREGGSIPIVATFQSELNAPTVLFGLGRPTRTRTPRTRSSISATSTAGSSRRLVYCFMPDHLHLLIEGKSDSANLKDFAKLAKQRSGWHYAQAHGKRLWQEGYYEHVLRGQEYPPQVICYIVENPVRAGLVTAPGEYPFWGSEKYTREEILEFAEASRRV
jgi:REP element-mobilizing transposase RayT